MRIPLVSLIALAAAASASAQPASAPAARPSRRRAAATRPAASRGASSRRSGRRSVIPGAGRSGWRRGARGSRKRAPAPRRPRPRSRPRRRRRRRRPPIRPPSRCSNILQQVCIPAANGGNFVQLAKTAGLRKQGDQGWALKQKDFTLLVANPGLEPGPVPRRRHPSGRPRVARPADHRRAQRLGRRHQRLVALPQRQERAGRPAIHHPLLAARLERQGAEPGVHHQAQARRLAAAPEHRQVGDDLRRRQDRLTLQARSASSRRA